MTLIEFEAKLKDIGLTKAAFGEKMGIPVQTIYGWKKPPKHVQRYLEIIESTEDYSDLARLLRKLIKSGGTK